MNLRAWIAPAAVAAATWDVWRWWASRCLYGVDAAIGLAPFGLAFASLAAAPRADAGRAGELRGAAALMFGYAAATPFTPPSVAAGCAFAALLLAMACAVRRRLASAAFGLVALALPVVPQLDFFAGYPLRAATTTIAQALLAVSGEDFARAGATLIRDGRTYVVDAPCSGVKSLWTALVLAATLSAFLRLRTRSSTSLAALAVLAVVVGNGLRTAMLCVLESRGESVSEGPHAGIGLAVFGAVAALLCGAARKARDASKEGGRPCAAP